MAAKLPLTTLGESGQLDRSKLDPKASFLRRVSMEERRVEIFQRGIKVTLDFG